jgi:hypothetical protein
LIDPEKNKVRMGFGFSAFASQHVGKGSFSAPNAGKKRRAREKVGQRNQARPEKRDQAQDQQPMPVEPVHGPIISLNR